MKIKTKTMDYAQVEKLPRPKHKKPYKPSRPLHALVRLLSAGELKEVGFSYSTKRMELAGNGPWLVLMNHSSFLDLKIASRILKGRPFNIVCTSDGLIGKEELMRCLGCIPTQKFVTDISLISDISWALKEQGSTVLMYPEASYSFDGRATALPRKMGVLLKRLGVPVIMITAYGSFARDPLYNNLQKRKVRVTATEECLFTPEELKELSVKEIDEILDRAFDFDYFSWQKDNEVVIDEPFRADGLNRMLFRCPHCLSEGSTLGKGSSLRCSSCGAEYRLDELGGLKCLNKEGLFNHVPDWYNWQRQEIRKEILCGSYSLDTEVDIGVVVDFKAVYMVGEGRLVHNANGFVLDGCNGKLHYEQGPKACYSVYSDFFWYELGDVICIGNRDCLYYCFPKQKDVAARTRIAAEELYRLCREKSIKNPAAMP